MRYLSVSGIEQDVSVLGLGTATGIFTPEYYHRAAELLDLFVASGGNCIDLYLLHRDDENAPVGPLVEALNAEQAQGRIRAFGASNWHSARVAAANAYATEHRLNGFSVSSLQFSLARPARMFFPGTVAAADVDLAWHTQEQMPLLAWSSLSAGWDGLDSRGHAPVAQTFETSANSERMQRAREVAAHKDKRLAQVALACVLHQPFPTIALVGPSTKAHLSELLEAVQLPLDGSDVAYIERG